MSGINKRELPIEAVETTESLKQQINFYKALIENMPGLVVLANDRLEIELCSHRFLDFTGWTKEEVYGKTPLDFVPERYKEATARDLSQVFTDGDVQMETHILTKSGREVPFAISGKSLELDGRTYALGIGVEITQRLAIEKELRFVNSLLQSQNEITLDGILIVDPDMKILFMNRMFLEMWSIPENMVRLNDHVNSLPSVHNQLVDPQDFQNTIDFIYSRPNETRRDIIELKDGRFFDRYTAPLMDDAKRHLGRIWYFRDITANIKNEEEQLRIRKFEAIGTLAAGIAHDFNNILTAVIGNLNMASMQVNIDSPAESFIKSAEKAALKAKELTYRLLTFSEGGTPAKKTSSIEEILIDTVEFVLSGSRVQYDFQFEPDLWKAAFDHEQIVQVIQNLVLNSVEAMPDGGTITISCSNFVHDGNSVPALGPGRFLKISVRDQGKGIEAENLDRIFDPYFTTSPLDRNKGKGLGLSIVHSIIKKHGGTVEVESEPGEGACFSFYLPATEVVSTHDPDLEKKSRGHKRPRILVMDDDEMVRHLASEMLHTIGYEAETAASGSETIKKYRQAKKAGKPFHGVILDLTIPGDKAGYAILAKLREIEPKVKAMVSSGYATSQVMQNFRDYGFNAVLQKPYRIEEMAEAVAEMLRHQEALK